MIPVSPETTSDRSRNAPAPLSGRTLVVTRPEAQAADLVEPLEDLGARVVLFPTIEIVPPEDRRPLRSAVREAHTYDWLLFTSVNGVQSFGRSLEEEGVDAAALAEGPRVCAIGPATGGALERLGLHPRVIPDEYVAEAVIEALDAEGGLQGARILLPRAAVARAALPEGLRERGAVVDVVEAYRTVPASGDTEALRRLLASGEIDLVTFTASSTVRNFHRAMGGRLPEDAPAAEEADPPAPPDPEADGGRSRGSTALRSVPVAAIGPITAGTARLLGYDVAVVAEEYTIPGLVDAVVGHLRGPPGGAGGPRGTGGRA